MLKMEEMNAGTATFSDAISGILFIGFFVGKRKNINNNYTENSTQGIGALVLISPDTLNNYIEVIQTPRG